MQHYIVATGIVVKEDKFLIVKRSNKEKAFPGRWTVPGGKLDPKDYSSKKPDTKDNLWYNLAENLVKREIKEETNLDIHKIGYATSLAYMRPDNIPTFIISFYCFHKSKEVKLCPALTDYAWVTLGQAKSYDLISGIFEELQMVDKILKGENSGLWKK